MNGYSETEHDRAIDAIAKDAGITGPGFTPGPWVLKTVRTSVGICHTIGPFPKRNDRSQEQHACVYADYEVPGAETAWGREMLANAHLIASAPDLYAIAARWLDQGDGIVAKGCPLGQLIEDTRSALAIARGEVRA